MVHVLFDKLHILKFALMCEPQMMVMYVYHFLCSDKWNQMLLQANWYVKGCFMSYDGE